MENTNASAMSQKIFEIGLPVEAVSLYLLCWGFCEAGVPIQTRQMMDKWNGSEQQFYESIRLLEDRNILVKTSEDKVCGSVYTISEERDWKI